MAKDTKFLRNFKKGDYLVWSVCSQCYYTGKVTMKDDTKTYFTAEKTSPITSLQNLGKGSVDYAGGANLRIEIDVPQSTGLDVTNQSSAILDKKSNNVGFVYDFCVEDSDDDDYNDFYINIVGWNKKG